MKMQSLFKSLFMLSLVGLMLSSCYEDESAFAPGSSFNDNDQIGQHK